MLQIIGLLLPLFALIVMGRLAVTRNMLTQAGVNALTGFTYWIALPALLFGSIAESPALALLDVSAVYLACCLAVFFAAMALSWWRYGPSVSRAAVFGLNATYGSAIYMGTPIVAAVFGPQGVSLILAIIAFHSGILLPLASVLIELDNPRAGGLGRLVRLTLLAMLRNPIIISIAAGFAWHGLDLAVPGPLRQFCAIVGPAASPLALFCLGASLPPLAVERSVLGEATIAMVLKMAVLPVCVGLASWAMGLPWNVAVVTACLPTGANVFLLASRATAYAQTSATTVVIAFVTSIVTVAGVLSGMR